MDDDSEENISLPSLNYGLESSVDNTGGSGMHDQTGFLSVGAHDDDDSVAGNQINMLQSIILEMKEGFQKALEELAKIQDKEEQEVNHGKRLQQQQQHQLDHLLTTIGDLKQHLNTLVESVEQIKEEHTTLKEHLMELSYYRKTETSQVHNRSNRVKISDDSTTNVKELSTEQPPDDGEHDVGMKRTNIELAANDLKSLCEESLKASISQSSNEENDEEIRTMTGNIKQDENFITDPEEDRIPTTTSKTRGHNRTVSIQSAVQRQHAVIELADSERNYCSQLWSLLYTYLIPLQSAGFLCPEVLDILFPPYLEQLYEEHCNVCTRLQHKLIHWLQATTVADLLVKILDPYCLDSLMTMYKVYTDNLPAALSYLRQALAESPELRIFLKATRHSSFHGDDFMTLLLSPAQRMPRYLLHLQEIYYHTPPTHADFPQLQAQLHELNSFVEELNDEVFEMLQDFNQDKHARFLPEEWLQNHNTHRRQVWDPPVHISTLSQPNLTACNYYTNFNRVSAFPQQLSIHTSRSQSARPSYYSNYRFTDARQQIPNFKKPRRPPTITGYPTNSQDHIHRSSSPWVRSSSAMDFLSHSYNQNQQMVYKHSIDGDFDDQPGNYKASAPETSPNSVLNYPPLASEQRPHSVLNQTPASEPRPLSVLGVQNNKQTRRPIVISRKKDIRQTQPHVSSSSWAETRTLPFRNGPQRVPLAINDLLAMRFPSIITDKDDTRVSDLYSFNTNESDPQSHSSESHDTCDHELDVSQSQHSHNKMAYQSAFATELAKENSTSDLTKDNTAINISGQQKITVEDDYKLVRQNSNAETKQDILVSNKETIQDNDIFKVQSLKDAHKTDMTDNSSSSLSKPAHIHTSTSKPDTLIPSKDHEQSEDSKTSAPSMGPEVSQEKKESFNSGNKPGSSNHTTNVESLNYVGNINGSEQLSQSNRKFLLSLSSRPATPRKMNLNETSLAKNGRNTFLEISSEHSRQVTYPQLNNDKKDLILPDMTIKSSKDLPPPPPRSSRTGEFYSLHISPSRDTIVKSAMEPEMAPNGLSQPWTSSPADSTTLSVNGARSTASLTNGQDLITRNESYASSSDSLSPRISNLSRLNSTIGSHQSFSKSNQRFITSTSFTSFASKTLETPQPKLENSGKHSNKCDTFITSPQNQDKQPLVVTDFDLNDKSDIKRETTKRIKNEGNITLASSLPLPNDNLANNLKKRTPFKASIKNLFAKKK